VGGWVYLLKEISGGVYGRLSNLQMEKE